MLEARSGAMKRSIEFLLDNRLGDWLDSRFMELTVRHWRRKFRDRYSEEEFRLIFKSSKRISKHHPSNFQEKVLQEFNRRKVKLEQQKNLDLSNVVFHLEERP